MKLTELLAKLKQAHSGWKQTFSACSDTSPTWKHLTGKVPVTPGQLYSKALGQAQTQSKLSVTIDSLNTAVLWCIVRLRYIQSQGHVIKAFDL